MTIWYINDNLISSNSNDGELFEGTFEEAEQYVYDNRCLEQCQYDKIEILKTKFQEYKNTHIRLDYNSNTYYIKATDNTKIEASTRELRVDQLSDPITDPLDRSWFSDFNNLLKVEITQIVFSSKLDLQIFLGSIGQYFQSKKHIYLIYKSQILNATTIEELDAIDLNSIDFGSNIITI